MSKSKSLKRGFVLVLFRFLIYKWFDMKTLKEARESLGVNQAEVAAKLYVSVPTLCNYENQAVPVPIEDAIGAEVQFGQPLKWNDQINPESKQNILKAINTLSQRYPLIQVLNFVQRWIKNDNKLGAGNRTINHYLGVSNRIHTIEGLYPTDVID